MPTADAYKPNGLGAEALQLWDDVTTTYQMRPDELRLLNDCCREIDLIERLQSSLKPGGKNAALTTRGSMGQTVANPLITEIRQHRTTLAALMKQLKLTDLAGAKGGEGESDTTVNARNAAIARWGRR